MAGTYELQIQTVYSEDDAVASQPGTWRLRLVAVLTLAVSIGWLYIAWGPVAKRVLNEATLAGAMLQAGGSMPGLLPQTATSETPDEDGAAEDAQLTPEQRHQAWRAQQAETQRAQITLVSLASAWIGVTTLIGLWLAMAGTAGLRAGRWAKWLGLLIAPLALLAVGAVAWHVQKEYAWLESLMPNWVLPVLVGLGVVFGASVGAMLQRRGARMLRWGGGLVVLSAIFSVGVIWAAQHWGNLPADPMAGLSYVKVFAVQSAYGWFLLLATIGLR